MTYLIYLINITINILLNKKCIKISKYYRNVNCGIKVNRSIFV